VPHPCFFLARVGDDDPGSKNREWKFSVLPKVPIGIQMKAQLRFMPTHPSKEKIEGWGTRLFSFRSGSSTEQFTGKLSATARPESTEVIYERSQ